MKDLKDIEKSIIKKYRKELYARVVHAVKDFSLIEEGDNIAVCISGGKDSFLLAKILQELKRHSIFKFNLTFLVMNPGYTEENLNKIKEIANHLNIPIIIKDSNIFEVRTMSYLSSTLLSVNISKSINFISISIVSLI